MSLVAYLAFHAERMHLYMVELSFSFILPCFSCERQNPIILNLLQLSVRSPSKTLVMPKVNHDSIVFLIRSYNEATRIRIVIERIFAAGFSNILVVDDGSMDGT